MVLPLFDLNLCKVVPLGNARCLYTLLSVSICSSSRLVSEYGRASMAATFIRQKFERKEKAQ